MSGSPLEAVAQAARDAVKFKSVIERQCVGDNAEAIAAAVLAALRANGAALVSRQTLDELRDCYGDEWTDGLIDAGWVSSWTSGSDER